MRVILRLVLVLCPVIHRLGKRLPTGKTERLLKRNMTAPAFLVVPSPASFVNLRQGVKTISTVCRQARVLMSSSSRDASRPALRGVVFDMDGTLIVPNIDYASMYRRCGIDRASDILQVLETLPAAASAEKRAIVEEVEAEALRTMALAPGALEVAAWLQAHKVPTALVTRNKLKAAEALQAQFAPFDFIFSRDHGGHPMKPDPAALLHIAAAWQVAPESIAMVGDSPANDIAFGNAAGAVTVLVGQRRAAEGAKGDVEPDIAVKNLYSLPRQLWQRFTISGALGTKVPPIKVPTPTPSNAASSAAAQGDSDALEAADSALWNAPDESGNTPLIWAADGGHLEVLTRLLESGVEKDVRGYLGATAVSRAANRGRSAVLKALVEAGADMNLCNDKMQYPLHFAAYKQQEEAVEILLRAGANLKVLDRKGRIPAEDTKNAAIREKILRAM